MTEKDYYKIKDYNIGKVEYLKISLKINKLDILLNKIKKFMIKKFNHLIQSVLVYLFF